MAKPRRYRIFITEGKTDNDMYDFAKMLFYQSAGITFLVKIEIVHMEQNKH